jgi:hypothetical protein
VLCDFNFSGSRHTAVAVLVEQVRKLSFSKLALDDTALSVLDNNLLELLSLLRLDDRDVREAVFGLRRQDLIHDC